MVNATFAEICIFLETTRSALDRRNHKDCSLTVAQCMIPLELAAFSY